jgi:tRNA G10  N-methylase Trm11
MQTFLTLPYEKPTALPSDFGSDPRTPPSYVEHFLTRYTEPGDVVFDPFAGFGTTLAVGEELGREAYGIEYEAERVAFIRERVDHPERVVCGSALELPTLDLPQVECCLTSPPYMAEEMNVNPFRNYATDSETTYKDYLGDIETVFADISERIVPGGTVLVDVSNIKHAGNVTTLAWDVAEAVAVTFDFAGEVVVGWEGSNGDDGNYGYGYDPLVIA